MLTKNENAGVAIDVLDGKPISRVKHKIVFERNKAAIFSALNKSGVMNAKIRFGGSFGCFDGHSIFGLDEAILSATVPLWVIEWDRDQRQYVYRLRDRSLEYALEDFAEGVVRRHGHETFWHELAGAGEITLSAEIGTYDYLHQELDERCRIERSTYAG